MARKYGLCIGINDYPGTDSDLAGCVNDALDWAGELTARGFEIERLLDMQATGEAIRNGLAALAQRAQPGDLVVVTFSGHGSFVVDEDGDEADGMDECWCPYDIVANGPISDDELNRIFTSRRPDVRWVVISDSCHSGTVTRFSHRLDEDGAAGQHQAVRFLAPEVFVQRLGRAGGLADHRFVASPPGRNSALLMSGCEDSEYSYDAYFQGRPNGAFTYSALRALRDLGGDATYLDWYRRVRRYLPSGQYPQSPNLYGDESAKAWEVLRLPSEVTEEATDSSDSADKPGSAAAFGHAQARRVIAERRGLAASVRGEPPRPRGQRPVLIAEGDSWFDFPGPDVLDCLEDQHGYDVFSVAHKGDTLEEMAYADKQLDSLLRLIEKTGPRAGRDLRAILLSGGGNDIAGKEFAQLINHRESPRPGLNEQIVAGIIDERLYDGYQRMLHAITDVCRHAAGREVPIILHGYDYAVPDGRGFWSGFWILPGPWLKPGLERKGFRELERGKSIVAQLIDRFNAMLERVARDLDHVHYVNLRKRLPNGADYKTHWADELHPSRSGFQTVARELHLAVEHADEGRA